ncbi:MAG TPA: hypothetical protein VGK39_08305 [Cyclobacteriaceae bacterium]
MAKAFGMMPEAKKNVIGVKALAGCPKPDTLFPPAKQLIGEAVSPNSIPLVIVIYNCQSFSYANHETSGISA